MLLRKQLQSPPPAISSKARVLGARHPRRVNISSEPACQSARLKQSVHQIRAWTPASKSRKAYKMTRGSDGSFA
eukprot:6194188-Pleurochrysis_carterae.AAC.6